MTKREGVVGKKIGRWTILSRFKNDRGRWVGECLCECGTKKVVHTDTKNACLNGGRC